MNGTNTKSPLLVDLFLSLSLPSLSLFCRSSLLFPLLFLQTLPLLICFPALLQPAVLFILLIKRMGENVSRADEKINKLRFTVTFPHLSLSPEVFSYRSLDFI